MTPPHALQRIAEEGGSEAVGLVGKLMDRNARETEWAEDQVRAGLEREIAEWRERARSAEARLARIEARLLTLLD